MARNKTFIDLADKRVLYAFMSVSVVLLLVLMLSLAVSPSLEYARSRQYGLDHKPQTKADPVKLENEYKIAAAAAVKEYLGLAEEQKLDSDNLGRIKSGLLSVKVPTRFKDLHISLVMAMVKMENFLANGKIDDKRLSEDTIIEARKSYAWLE